MAWISIHQSINGAKLRRLSKRIGCSRHEAIGILTALWLWGLDNIEPDGRITDADRSDVANEVFSGNISPNLSPAHVVDALIDSGWIDLSGDHLYLHDWEQWQAPWYSYRERAKKDADRKRRGNSARHSAGNSAEIPQETPQEFRASPTPTPTPTPTPNLTNEVVDGDGLGSELTNDEIKKAQEFERNVLPGIEAVCRECGMKAFDPKDEETVRNLCQTYTPDEICAAVAAAKEQGKVFWAYIKGVLKNRGRSGSAGYLPSQGGQNRRRDGAQGVDLQTTRL